MSAKFTARNKLTLPNHALEAAGQPTQFGAVVEDGRPVLTAVRLSPADAARREIAELGITEQNVADAVAWARHGGR